MKQLLTIVIFLTTQIICFAQFPDSIRVKQEARQNTSIEEAPDTTAPLLPQSLDSLPLIPTKEDKGYGVFSAFSGNPGKAALYSLIVPGAGQAYNKRWWKVPVAVAAEATVIYFLQENISEFRKWDDEVNIVLEGGTSTLAPNISESAIIELRDSARSNRDITWVVLIGTHIIVAADAFVDRHLIEFDIDDDLSLRFSPISPYPGINLALQF